jgi:hypothetical protein
MDEPSSGIPSEVASTPHGNQNLIQDSENLEDLDILISAASNRRRIDNDKIQHELAIIDIERLVAEQRQILLSKLDEQSAPPAAILQLPSANATLQLEKQVSPENRLAAVFNAKELVVLTDIVTAAMADKFKDQS